MAKREDFNRDVPLPPGLTVTAIQKAIEYIEKGLADLVEIYLEQANVFSALRVRSTVAAMPMQVFLAGNPS